MEITIGSKITVNLNGHIKKFQIVGSADVDASNGKISYLSPIGEALLGRKINEKFIAELPDGEIIQGTIMAIT